MNFIYDILINFNDSLYDFYEWNISDNVVHIRKIPLFRISTCELDDIKNFVLKFDFDFIKKLENKTEKFTSKDVEKILYASLFSDGKDVVAVKFNSKGISYQVSKLLIDEQEEVLEVVENFNNYVIKYEKLNKKNSNDFKTRMQVEKYNYILRLLNKLEKKQEIDKLKYLYFECFGLKQNSIDVIVKDLKNSLDRSDIEKTVLEFFKLISIN